MLFLKLLNKYQTMNLLTMLYPDISPVFVESHREIILLSYACLLLAIAIISFYVYFLRKSKWQKEQENYALKLNERILNSIVEPVCWLTKEGIILKVLNRPDEKFLGISGEKVVGFSISRFTFDEKEMERCLRLLYHTIEHRQTNHTKVHISNGKGKEFCMVARMVYYDDSKILCFLQDISNLERQRIRSEQLKDQAEESNRLKSAFLANMSHEIRTPLNAIVGFSGILPYTEDESEKREYISIIEHNNKLLLQLIDDVLDLAKIEAGIIDFHFQPVDVNQIFEEIEQGAKLRLQNKPVELFFEERLPGYILRTDRNRMMQVVMNFVTNAIKFTEAGSICMGYRLKDPQTIYFYVADTGIGLSDSERSRVFERFVKLNSFIQGTGLGLSISRTIVTKMGGEIGVDSVPGKGSVFWFTLPNR